jgi:hypothetical protein
MRLCSVVASGAALLMAGSIAAAQTVCGTVRDLVGKGALTEVAVSLLDSRDSTLLTVRSGRNGSFRIAVPAPGTYSLALRAVAFEPMTTTAFRIDSGSAIKLEFEMARAPVVLDTIEVLEENRLSRVTRGRTQFQRHYREGRGMFLSGAEILASKKGLGQYISELPGFADFKGDKAPDVGPMSCQGLNAELSGDAPRMTTTNRTRSSQMNRREDLCALRDEMGRAVYPVDAPCVTTQVNRMGLVKRIEGTTLIVHRSQRTFVPSSDFTLSEAERVTPIEIVVSFNDVIGVEFYQKSRDVPANLRIRGATPEAEVMVSKCAHVQIWTRMAW